MANNVVNFKRGTAAQYNAATKDADTLYFVTSSGGSPSVEMGELFLGSVRIGVGIGTSADPSTNKTYYGLKNYVDGSFVSAVAEGTGNGQIAVTKNGTTTQVSVHGLGSAAYTASTAYATAAQGTKADSAVQDVLIESTAHSSYFLSASKDSSTKEVTLTAKVYNGGAVPLSFDSTNGLVAGISSSYVDGTLDTSNKLLTKSAADGYYGAKASSNTWTGSNTFSGSDFYVNATNYVDITANSGGNVISTTDSTELNIGDTTYDAVYLKGYVEVPSGSTISWGTAPSQNSHLANKKYVDDQIAGLGHAMRYVGDSSTVPTTSGATVADLPSGFTWKIGDTVTCSVSGYTGKEYLLFQGGTNIAANWREIGDESTYALKTTQITASNGLTVTSGGTLASNTNIAIDSTTKTKIDNSIQGLSVGTDGDLSSALSISVGSNKQASFNMYSASTAGSVGLGVNANGELYGDIRASYVDGTLSTSNLLLTKSKGDTYYGRLASANTWSASNQFNVSTGTSFKVHYTSDGVDAFSVTPTSVGGTVSIGNSFFSTTISGSSTIIGDDTGSTLTFSGGITASTVITCSTAPTLGNHLTNKTYVDSAVTTALTWASI